VVPVVAVFVVAKEVDDVVPVPEVVVEIAGVEEVDGVVEEEGVEEVRKWGEEE